MELEDLQLVVVAAAAKELGDSQGRKKELLGFQHETVDPDSGVVGGGEPMSSPQTVQLAHDE